MRKVYHGREYPLLIKIIQATHADDGDLYELRVASSIEEDALRGECSTYQKKRRVFSINEKQGDAVHISPGGS
jgi:hypothetical protein